MLDSSFSDVRKSEINLQPFHDIAEANKFLLGFG